jgi:hypothetical protein
MGVSSLRRLEAPGSPRASFFVHTLEVIQMPYVPEKHDEFLTYERTLSYGDRVERLLAMQKKGLDHNDTEHRMSTRSKSTATPQPPRPSLLRRPALPKEFGA